MSKKKFVKDYNIRTLPKVLYPYLSTPRGLSEWFEVKIEEIKGNYYRFLWDKETFYVIPSSQKPNKQIRYDVFDKEPKAGKNVGYFEFKLNINELTSELYLQITDQSDEELEELEDFWDARIYKLKEILGS